MKMRNLTLTCLLFMAAAYIEGANSFGGKPRSPSPTRPKSPETELHDSDARPKTNMEPRSPSPTRQKSPETEPRHSRRGSSSDSSSDSSTYSSSDSSSGSNSDSSGSGRAPRSPSPTRPKSPETEPHDSGAPLSPSPTRPKSPETEPRHSRRGSSSDSSSDSSTYSSSDSSSGSNSDSSGSGRAPRSPSPTRPSATAIPTVKCSKCGKLFPQKELKGHMWTHIWDGLSTAANVSGPKTNIGRRSPSPTRQKSPETEPHDSGARPKTNIGRPKTNIGRRRSSSPNKSATAIAPVKCSKCSEWYTPEEMEDHEVAHGFEDQEYELMYNNLPKAFQYARSPSPTRPRRRSFFPNKSATAISPAKAPVKCSKCSEWYTPEEMEDHEVAHRFEDQEYELMYNNLPKAFQYARSLSPTRPTSYEEDKELMLRM